jgi:phosphate-selective porin OprO/OprP
LVLKDPDYNLHVGVSANGIIQLPDTTAPGAAFNNTIQLRERPELRVDGTRLIDTGGFTADSVVAYGAELGFNYKNFVLAGEYFTIDVDRLGALRDPDFDGWYTQASYTLTGERRAWSPITGGLGGIKPDKPFDLKSGQWGAWEIAARYSTLDLNFNEGAPNTTLPAASGGFRGGQQDITSFGLNFYPNNVVRFLLDYQLVDIDRRNPSAVAAAAPFPAIPAGSQIGQDYQAVTLRTQVSF